MNIALTFMRDFSNNILQKRIPWNISMTIVLVIGVAILMSFIAYSHAGISNLQVLNPPTVAHQSVEIEILPSASLLTRKGLTAKDELETGLDEREIAPQDEIIPPNVSREGMPPLASIQG